MTVARERNPLPPGAGAVGIALAVSGVASYGFLVISARALGKGEYSPLSVLWALVIVVGPGCFLPVEQEIARALAARRSQGLGGGPVVRRAAALSLVLLGVLGVLGVALGPFLTDHLFSGNPVLLLGLLGSLGSACAGYLLRGTLSGLGRFRGYGRLLGAEAATRFGLAGLLTVLGVHTAGPFALALAAGPLLAVAFAISGERPLLEDGPPAPWAEMTTALGWLLLGSVLSMGLLNAGPIAVQALADARQEDEAGTFLAGLVVARVPLFLFQAVQASLLPRLSELAGRDRTKELRDGLARLVTAVVGFASIGVVGAWLVGPTVVRIMFGGDFELSRRTMALLALGSGALMVATLLAQATIALGGHRRMAFGWLAGFVALVAVIAVPGEDLFLRIELGCVAGGAAAAATHGLLLRRLLRGGPRMDPGDLIEAIHDFPLEP